MHDKIYGGKEVGSWRRGLTLADLCIRAKPDIGKTVLQATGAQRAVLLLMAMVEVEPRRGIATHAALELVLTTGEQLRISAGVDAATSRQVLEALRA